MINKFKVRYILMDLGLASSVFDIFIDECYPMTMYDAKLNKGIPVFFVRYLDRKDRIKDKNGKMVPKAKDILLTSLDNSARIYDGQ